MPDHPTTRRRGAFDRFLARPASLLIASLAIICVTVASAPASVKSLDGAVW
jgi:hypothetical protein